MRTERTLQPVMNAILVFECVGRVGSFSAAAREMGTSQPSVSRHISNLESYLACKLFSRQNNQISLTEAGEKLFQPSRTSITALANAIAECRGETNRKVLTIGCTHGFSHLWIMPRFSSLQTLLKDWELRVVTSEHYPTFGLGDVDFSIRFCEYRLPQQGELLFKEEVILVAAPDFLANHAQYGIADMGKWLQQVPLIHLDNGEEGWMSWQSWFAHNDAQYQPPSGTYFLQNYAFSLQAAAEGKGVALAWRNLLGSYQDNGWLDVLDIAPAKTSGSYRLLYSSEWRKHEIRDQIVNWFKAEFGSANATE